VENPPQVPAAEVREEVKSDEIASGESDPQMELMDSGELSHENEKRSDKVETEAETSTTAEPVEELQSDEKVQQSAEVR
jgi:hypothetical protein